MVKTQVNNCVDLKAKGQIQYEDFCSFDINNKSLKRRRKIKRCFGYVSITFSTSVIAIHISKHQKFELGI